MLNSASAKTENLEKLQQAKKTTSTYLTTPGEIAYQTYCI